MHFFPQKEEPDPEELIESRIEAHKLKNLLEVAKKEVEIYKDRGDRYSHIVGEREGHAREINMMGKDILMKLAEKVPVKMCSCVCNKVLDK